MGEPEIIEFDFNVLFFKNKVIHYSDTIFNIDGYSSISFRAVKNKIDAPSFSCNKEICYIIDLTQSLEEIWNNMNRNAHRNIKKAEKEGINIEFNKGYQEFYKMYEDHLKSKKHLKWYNIHKLDEIKKHGTLVIAKYGNDIISGSVFLEDENNIIYWITASYRYSPKKIIRQLSGNATYLIHWEIIKYAKLKDIKEYNLGPCAYDDRVNKKLQQFKKSLGSEPHTYYKYCKDYNFVYKLMRKSYQKLTGLF